MILQEFEGPRTVGWRFEIVQNACSTRNEQSQPLGQQHTGMERCQNQSFSPRALQAPSSLFLSLSLFAFLIRLSSFVFLIVAPSISSVFRSNVPVATLSQQSTLFDLTQRLWIPISFSSIITSPHDVTLSYASPPVFDFRLPWKWVHLDIICTYASMSKPIVTFVDTKAK